MNDNEIRGKLLKELYDKRKEDYVQIGLDHLNDPKAQETIRIATQLHEYGLIEFKMLNRHLGGMARITARGVDVIEGNARSPISISIGESKTINISHSSNVQIGDNNSQTINNGIAALIKTINESNASETEKEEAKSLLKKFLGHPIIAAVVGAAATALFTPSAH